MAIPVAAILPVAFSSHVGLKMHRRGSVDLSLYIDEEAADGCRSSICGDDGEGEDRQSDIDFIDNGIETGDGHEHMGRDALQRAASLSYCEWVGFGGGRCSLHCRGR